MGPYNPYVGSGNVNRVIAWSGGKPALVGSPQGIFGANEPWNAASKPYWSALRGWDVIPQRDGDGA